MHTCLVLWCTRVCGRPSPSTTNPHCCKLHHTAHTHRVRQTLASEALSPTTCSLQAADARLVAVEEDHKVQLQRLTDEHEAQMQRLIAGYEAKVKGLTDELQARGCCVGAVTTTTLRMCHVCCIEVMCAPCVMPRGCGPVGGSASLCEAWHAYILHTYMQHQSDLYVLFVTHRRPSPRLSRPRRWRRSSRPATSTYRRTGTS